MELPEALPRQRTVIAVTPSLLDLKVNLLEIEGWCRLGIPARTTSGIFGQEPYWKQEMVFPDSSPPLSP
jgi:hypothetical protein